MKQTPELDLVQEKMRPGVLTLKGFLGHDDRKLADIIETDHQVVRRLQLDVARIAAKLVDLAERGRDLMEQEVLVDDRYLIKVRDDRGKIPSPWSDGLFEKGDVDMRDQKTGKTLKWNSLTLRLMQEHGFFGGYGSEYRIDPAALVEILGLAEIVIEPKI